MKIGLILGLLIHLTVLVIGMVINYLAVLFPLVNGLSAAAFICWWIWKQARINQHIFEQRELVVLGFELLVLCGSLYFIFTRKNGIAAKSLQYIVFGIHASCLIGLLVFMLTFKMRRLI